MKIEQHEKNVHVLKLKGNKCQIAMLSDLHWDNPKMRLEIVKKTHGLLFGSFDSNSYQRRFLLLYDGEI